MLDAKHGNSRASGAQVCALARGGVSPPAVGGLPVPQELGAVGPQPLRGYPSPTGLTSSLPAQLLCCFPPLWCSGLSVMEQGLHPGGRRQVSREPTGRKRTQSTGLAEPF